jgi:uncharacterized membrane protein HdeD (DUF308 family)
MNTKSGRQGLVLGGLLILFGVLALIENFTDFSVWIWVAVLVIGGLVVYAIYAADREEKWILIISYAMLAVAGLLTLLELGILQDAFIATYVLLAIALPFLVAFLFNRENWGLKLVGANSSRDSFCHRSFILNRSCRRRVHLRSSIDCGRDLNYLPPIHQER